MSVIYDAIEKNKIVPVITLNNSSDAKPLGEALCKGGLPVGEITFRTDAAEESIKIMTKEFPNMIIGAGSISSELQAQKAIDAGAKFLVSAGFNRKVTEFAINNKIPIFPGVCTPTELMLIVEYNLPVAKFFPASQFGGLKTIKALSGPFPKIKFMPTGGISEANILEYLSFDKIIACGGSWMVKETLIKEKKFDEIASLTHKAVNLVKSV